MVQVNITAAKAKLSALIKRVEDTGEEIVIDRMGRRIVKIIKYKPERKINRVGILQGKIKVAPDFDLWPEDIAESLGMKDKVMSDKS